MAEQILSFADAGEEQGHVIDGDDPYIAVEGIHGIDRNGGAADRGEGGVDPAGNDATIAYHGDNEFGGLSSTAIEQPKGEFDLETA
jgi:hypothetical protein